MSNAMGIVLIGVGIFAIYLEQSGKLKTVLGSITGTGAGGGGISDTTSTTVAPVFRGRYYVTTLGKLNVTDAGAF